MGSTTFIIESKGHKFDTVEQIQPFLDELNQLELVEKITLSGNTFGVEATKAFAEALKNKKKLKVLDLSDIFTGRLRSEIPLALTAICDAIMDKEELVELNLSDNAFGPAGAEPLVEFLINNKALETLRLNNNGLGIQGGTLIANALIKGKEVRAANGKGCTLRTIVAGRNRLENGSSPLLAKAFQAHDSLTEIRLPQNGIRSEGVVMLLEALSNLPNLEILDLQDNTFTEVGSEALCTALPNWNKLRVLNVGDCLLKAKGGLLLADALAEFKPKHLQELILTYNEINTAGAAKLSKAILSLPSLKKLELNGNNFDAESSVIDQLKNSLRELGAEEALGSLSDMELLSDEEDDDEEVDQLADKLSKIET